jgi:uncharacterized protein (DUF58 family)
MKTKRINKILISTSLSLLSLGIILTSVPLIVISAYPLLLMLIPPVPVKVEILRSEIYGGNRVGEEFEVKILLRLRGLGVVKMVHKIPEHFELKEGSNALTAFIPGFLTVEIVYRGVPTKRGEYELKNLVVEYENLVFTQKGQKVVNLPLELEVKSKLYRIRKIELRRGVARNPIPEIDVSTIGVPGTDFREIRKYVAGDPVKFINWKASAKLGEMMANQFEVEGKKSIWIFLDANPYMIHGTVLRNYLEAAIELANSLCYYFAVRGYRIGFYAVGHGALIYPDAGRKQFAKISRVLNRLEVSERKEDLMFAVEASRKYIEAYKPAFIFITRVEFSNPLRAAVKASGRRKLPVKIIALKSGGDELATLVVEHLRQSMVRRLRAGRFDVIEWDVNRTPKSVLAGVMT